MLRIGNVPGNWVDATRAPVVVSTVMLTELLSRTAKHAAYATRPMPGCVDARTLSFGTEIRWNQNPTEAVTV